MTNTLALHNSIVTPETSELISLEDAFAFIILLDEQVAINKLDNVHNCRAFSSFDELRACVDGAGPRIQSKPVIILSRDARPRRDHLVTAVASHWRYGGKYVLSRVKCCYLSKTGELQITPVRREEMHRTALLPGVLTMPVREAILPHSHLLLFVPSDGFTVCVPDMTLSKEELSRLEHAFTPELQTPAEFERLAKMGALNQSILRQLPIGNNWPLAHQIAFRLNEYQRLNLDLESREFSKASAEATILRIKKSEDDLVYLPEKLGEFLLALSERSEVLLSLDVPVLNSYIELARQCSKSDEIALRLCIISHQLCRIDSRLIFPLFEFLAGNLSSEALNAAYSFAADHFEDAQERCIRLAQSMRRFGHETSLALLLANIYRARPKWFEKRSVLRSFRPLLASPLLPALASQVGETTVLSIEAVMNITDRFRAAVLAGDRALAKQILLDEDGLATVDFVPWMHSLRGLSNELREVGLSVIDLKIPGISSPTWQRLAAVRLSDLSTIEALRAAGALADRDDLNAVAHSMAGDNTMLNGIISERFASTPYIPISVRGETASEVFKNAARSTRASDKVSGPLVSVIMSAYNPDLTLMKIALHSIASQTWRNIEVIIVDDASEDAAEYAIKELAARYNNVKTLRVGVNSGPYIGRNLALQLAKGEFIAIQDADDWSHPQRLAAQVEVLLNTPEARAVTTEHIRVNRVGHVSLESGFRIFGDGPMTSVFRSELFKQIGGFAAVRSRGDLEMHERIAAYYGFQANATLPLPMALCYADSRTLSHSTADKKGDHIQLFHSNISRLPAMTSLFRDGLPLHAQTPVPMMLRAPRDPHC